MSIVYIHRYLANRIYIFKCISTHLQCLYVLCIFVCVQQNQLPLKKSNRLRTFCNLKKLIFCDLYLTLNITLKYLIIHLI